MQCRQPNGSLAATWILAGGLIGLLDNVTAVGGAAIVFGLGLVPLLLLLRWNQPVHAVRVRQANP